MATRRRADARIAAVIPTHRSSRQLIDAIESARCQKSVPAEIIVVTNGVGIDWRELRRTLDDRIEIVNEDRVGAAYARNTAMRVASSMYCAFLDSDDTWAPDYLCRVQDAIRCAPDAALFAGGARVLNSQGARVIKPPTSRQLHLKSLVRRNPISTSAAVVHRESALEVGGFQEGLHLAAGCEDLGLWLKLAMTHRLAPAVGAFCERDERGERPRTAGDEEFYEDLETVLRLVTGPSGGVNGSVVQASLMAHRSSVCLASHDVRRARAHAWRSITLDNTNPRAWAWLLRSLARRQ